MTPDSTSPASEAVERRDAIANLVHALQHWEREAAVWTSTRHYEVPGWMASSREKGTRAIQKYAALTPPPQPVEHPIARANLRIGEQPAPPADARENAVDGLRSAETAVRYALAAIDTGRSEPLFIARDILRNWLADHSALSTPVSRPAADLEKAARAAYLVGTDWLGCNDEWGTMPDYGRDVHLDRARAAFAVLGITFTDE